MEGITRGFHQPTPVCTVWVALGCSSTASMSWTSAGTITQVTVRSAWAIRKARSTMWRTDDGVLTCWHHDEATSEYSCSRLTSCWKSPAHGPHEGLADDGHHRLMVQLGVVQPVQQVDRPRPRGGHAHPDLAGELGVPARHERRHLLMAGLDEPQLVLVAAQRAEDPVDPVAGEAVDGVDPPLDQTLAKVVSCGLSWPLLLLIC